MYYYCAFQEHAKTLEFKGQPTNAFSLPSMKCSAALPSFRLLPSARLNEIVEHSSDNEIVFGNSRRIAKHLIDGREERIRWLSLEF